MIEKSTRAKISKISMAKKIDNMNDFECPSCNVIPKAIFIEDTFDEYGMIHVKCEKCSNIFHMYKCANCGKISRHSICLNCREVKKNEKNEKRYEEW